MNRNEFENLFARKALPSVLLFEGEEAHLREAAVASLRAAFLPAGLEELNEAVLEAPETDALIAAAETVPFMAEKRLVIVRDHPALTGRADSPDDRLLAYLPKVPASTILLFDCAQKPDARKKLYTAVKKLGGVVTFSRLQGRELTLFVVRAFRDRGKNCDERTADFLVFTCGDNAATLLCEVEKIASAHPEAPDVTAEDIRALAVPSVESRVFDLVDAVVAGQETRAFSILRKLLLMREDRVAILAMLLRQYRLLQHVKIMQYEKRSQQEAASALGLSPYVFSQYLRQAALCTGGQVRRGVKICLDADYSIKSGASNPEGTLEAVMLKLLLLRKKD